MMTSDAHLPRAIGFLLFGAVYVFVLPFIGYVPVQLC